MMTMTPERAVLASILICVGGAFLALLVSRNKTLAGWLSFLTTAFTAVLILSAVARVLTEGPSPHPATFWAAPVGGFALRIYVDGLSAWFLMLAALIAIPAAFYSIAHMRYYRDYSAARYYPNFLLFLAGMYGLLSTTDMMWVFFLFWQLMTFPSYLLVRFEYKQPGAVRAANKYLLLMQLACVLAMIAAKLLSRPAAGSLPYDFDTLSANLPLLLSTRPALPAIAFALFLIGFGIKAGMWPFGQLWIPEAYSAAPSPASAVFSGVMSKTGIYGLIRCFLWLVPAGAQNVYPLARWGGLIAVLGTITLFTGTMQALKQEHSHRLLAFHSIGQIGYMLLGIGTSMVLLSCGSPAAVALAAVGLLGALYHVLNHGLFKGLLFLNAGSMLHATGTRDLNQLGGLMKFMPLTAITALVASFSISGVPLFNGFVSKWSIYVAAIQGGGFARYLPVFAAIAILTSALTLASFIKFFGVSFLSRTSPLVKERAAQSGRLEVPWMMQVPQVVLGLLCILLGVVPAIGFRLLQHALAASPGGIAERLVTAAPGLSAPMTGIAAFQSSALLAPVVLAAVLGLLFLMSHRISKLGGATRRTASPWLCGYVREADCHRYVAHNFYGEIKRYFRWLGGMPRASANKPPAVRGLP